MVVYYHELDREGNDIRFAQNTMLTLIGGDLKTTLFFIDVLAGRHCYWTKPTACLTL